jgi:hypothetical protein
MFENNVNDLLGTNNGTAVSVSYSTTAKDKGYSLSLSGTASYAYANTVTAYNNTNFSWAFWTKHSSQNDKVLVGMSDANSSLAVIQTGAAANVGKVRYTVNDSGSPVLALDSATSVNDNNWHHVVVTDANGVVVIYIDGVQDATGSYTRPSCDMDHTTFGVYWHYINGYIYSLYTGLLDDIRFYNHILSAEEVRALYISYGVPLWKQYLSRWTLDNTVNDEVGVYNGTAFNMTYSAASKVSGNYSGVLGLTQEYIQTTLRHSGLNFLLVTGVCSGGHSVPLMGEAGY